jgi:hypothetical protein
MASSLSLSWAEAKSYLADLETVLGSDEKEYASLAMLRQLKADIAHLAAGREANAKKIISGAH